MPKIIFFLILNFFFLSSCSLENLKNKLSQNNSILNIYADVNSTKTKLIKFYNDSLENFLLKFFTSHKNYWNIEDSSKRFELPSIKFMEPEKNPTQTNNKNEFTFNNWYRSHGNHNSNRFSELKLININNIQNIEISWIFNSGEPQSIQCNPIIVDGIIYTPISGNYIAAIDGSNGKLIWKSKKFRSTLAKRGIVYWKDSKSKIERIFFSNQKNLVSLNAKNGSFDDKFGSNGIVRTGYNLLPPAIYKNQLIIATLYPDHNIESYDILTGKLNWKLKFKKTYQKKLEELIMTTPKVIHGEALLLMLVEEFFIYRLVILLIIWMEPEDLV